MKQEKFYSIKDFAKIFDLHQQTIVRMIQRKELDAIKIANRWRIPQYEMDRIKELCDVGKE